MKNFKDGFNDFKKGGSDFGGRPKFGFAGGAGRKSGSAGGGFNKPRFDNRGGERPAGEMFAATCSSCQKSCEVPFRPNGEKPVYCSACFGKMRDDNERGGDRNDGFRNDRREKPAFVKSDRPSYSASASSADSQKELQVIKAQLAKIELQLNRVLEFVNPPMPKVSKEIAKSVATEVTVKTPETETPKKVRKPKTEKVVKEKAVKKAAKKVVKKAAAVKKVTKKK